MASHIGLSVKELEHALGLGQTGNGSEAASGISGAQASTTGPGPQFEMLDKSSSSTLKRNPKMELSKTDLLKLLGYMEGELQARDIVIAALKSEKVKQVLQQTRYRPLGLNDPYAALFRDSVAVCGTKQSPGGELERQLADQQMESLENLVLQQRQTQLRMASILKDAEDKHKKVIQELEEEKRKHEHDTAQGDDITYGLEMERTRLKQELESEKQARKKSEKELKKQQDTLEEERARQKQIVLLLLAERKKIIMKYIEERKRSEDLAQILSEEKVRIDTMAEGLEEESKKSLSMEAELEKQTHLFENERKVLRCQISKEEKRARELDMELSQLRSENDIIRKALESGAGVTGIRPVPPRMSGGGISSNAPQLPAKPSRTSSISGSGVLLDGQGICEDPSATGSSVAKVVQPTATVSSVPVCAPTTGIARSISPGQGLRQTGVGVCSSSTIMDSHFNITKVGARKLSAPSSGVSGAKSNTSVLPQPLPKKGTPVGRGVPPPIPPNKPVVPPKRDPVVRHYDNLEDAKKNSTGNSTKDKGTRGEPLGEELADFQQMLVTMTNKT